MAPPNLAAQRWTPTRERALNMVKEGRVRHVRNIHGNYTVEIGGASMVDKRTLAKAVLWLEERGVIRMRKGGSFFEPVPPTPLDGKSIPELMMELHDREAPHDGETIA